MELKTILEKTVDTIIVERSKFITYFFPCDSKEKANEIILNVRKEHADATHVCYGYIVFDETLLYKSSDDGEPSQTAGAPILNVLKKNNLTNVICLVVRYFGGIKLGAGGLTRTYSNAASNGLLKAKIVTLVDAYCLDLIFNYELTKDIDKILEVNNLEIVSKSYNLKVTYKILSIDKQKLLDLKDKISYLDISFGEFETTKIRK